MRLPLTIQLMEESNAIIVPLEIKLDKLHELENVVKRLREVEKDIPENARVKSPGLGDSPTTSRKGETAKSLNDDVGQAMEEFFKNSVGTSPKEGAQNAMQLLSNPQGYILGLMTNPYVISAFAVIGGAKFIHELLTIHGGIFDLHFKRETQKELIKGRDLQTKQAIRVGLGASVVITSKAGTNTPGEAFHSFEAVRSGEMENIKALQIRKGYGF